MTEEQKGLFMGWAVVVMCTTFLIILIFSFKKIARTRKANYGSVEAENNPSPTNAPKRGLGIKFFGFFVFLLGFFPLLLIYNNFILYFYGATTIGTIKEAQCSEINLPNRYGNAKPLQDCRLVISYYANGQEETTQSESFFPTVLEVGQTIPVAYVKDSPSKDTGKFNISDNTAGKNFFTFLLTNFFYLLISWLLFYIGLKWLGLIKGGLGSKVKSWYINKYTQPK